MKCDGSEVVQGSRACRLIGQCSGKGKIVKVRYFGISLHLPSSRKPDSKRQPAAFTEICSNDWQTCKDCN